MAQSGVGLWVALRNSPTICLYHTETFRHLQVFQIFLKTFSKPYLYKNVFLGHQHCIECVSRVGCSLREPAPKKHPRDCPACISGSLVGRHQCRHCTDRSTSPSRGCSNHQRSSKHLIPCPLRLRHIFPQHFFESRDTLCPSSSICISEQ